MRSDASLVAVIVAACSADATVERSSEATNEATSEATSAATSATSATADATSGADTASGDNTTGIAPFEPDPSWQRWEVRAPAYAVPTDETTYACFGATFTVDALAQIVAFEPIVDETAVVHHMIVARASVPIDTKVPCYPDAPQSTMQWGWAPGSTALALPDEAGMLVGDDGAQVHYVVQIHYNNPLGTEGIVDNSGVALYVTSELRANEAAIWALGEVGDLVIPPGEPSWETIHVCSSASTTTLLAEPVNVFGSWLHAHSLGRALWTEQKRGDVVVATLGRQDPFDFDNQHFEPLDAIVEPGDALFTHCIYDSTSRTETTVGGGGTDNEMCLNYLLYWPRQPFVTYCND